MSEKAFEARMKRRQVYVWICLVGAGVGVVGSLGSLFFMPESFGMGMAFVFGGIAFGLTGKFVCDSTLRELRSMDNKETPA